MPRRSRRDAVAQRTEQRLAEQAERRREAAQRGAQTRRQRRAQRESEAQSQPAANRRAQAPTTRRSRARVHGEMVTVAIRGPLADRMRALAENHGMSLSKLLKDAILVYQGQMEAGYEPGTSLTISTPERAR
ncbi:MAG: hypothetical protein JXA57_10735 [Armatimonadetes bacterium]|nr:hypothetical protein [Armatimonadota bacterium]